MPYPGCEAEVELTIAYPADHRNLEFSLFSHSAGDRLERSEPRGRTDSPEDYTPLLSSAKSQGAFYNRLGQERK
jgi:hypothetical protein